MVDRSTVLISKLTFLVAEHSKLCMRWQTIPASFTFHFLLFVLSFLQFSFRFFNSFSSIVSASNQQARASWLRSRITRNQTIKRSYKCSNKINWIRKGLNYLKNYCEIKSSRSSSQIIPKSCSMKPETVIWQSRP